MPTQPSISVFSSEDVAILNKALAIIKRMKEPHPRSHDRFITDQEQQAPETYIARAPSGGIAGLDENSVGDLEDDVADSADCQVYSVDQETGVLGPIEGFYIRVYNFSTEDIGAYEWILATKDKFGIWWASRFSTSVFPARIDLVYDNGTYWEYAWTEMEWASKGAAATAKTGGRKGYTTPHLVIATTVNGTAGTPETQTARIYGPPFGSGTWSLGGATGLAHNITAGDLETALEAALSLSLTVTGSMSAGFTIAWVANGDRSLLTGSVSGLYPAAAAGPAYELNDWKQKVGAIVWMKTGYVPANHIVYTVTKTGTGSFSMSGGYISGGSCTLLVDGTETAAIIVGSTAATVKAAIEAAVPGLTLSTFSGAGTIASPWTFSVTSDDDEHTLTTGDMSELISDGDYRFAGSLDTCSWDGITGYDATASMNVLTINSSGCLVAVQPEACP